MQQTYSVQHSDEGTDVGVGDQIVAMSEPSVSESSSPDSSFVTGESTPPFIDGFNGGAGMPTYHTRKLFCLSAFDKDSAQIQAANLLEYLKRQSTKKLESRSFFSDLAYTLSDRRSLFSWRSAISASSPRELIEILGAQQTNFAKSNKRPKVGFCFTGQGAQWFAMGRELMRMYPVFMSSITMSTRILKDLGAEWDIYGE